jgi:hypothetical protein
MGAPCFRFAVSGWRLEFKSQTNRPDDPLAGEGNALEKSAGAKSSGYTHFIEPRAGGG